MTPTTKTPKSITNKFQLTIYQFLKSNNLSKNLRNRNVKLAYQYEVAYLVYQCYKRYIIESEYRKEFHMFFSFLFHLVELYTSIEKIFKQQRIFQPRDSECEY